MTQVQEQSFRRESTRATLFFMPHCESDLTNQVLAANGRQLHSVAILGNSFHTIATHWSHLSASARKKQVLVPQQPTLAVVPAKAAPSKAASEVCSPPALLVECSVPDLVKTAVCAHIAVRNDEVDGR